MPVPYPDGRELWANTAASIPANWTRDTAFDGRFLLGGGDSYTGPTNGGSVDHTHVATAHKHVLAAHEHTFSGGQIFDPPGLSVNLGFTRILPSRTHDHDSVFSNFDAPVTYTDNTIVTFPVQSNDWRAVEMIVIKPDDAIQEIPDDAFCWTNETSLPAGFTKITDGTWENVDIKAPTTGGDGGSRVGEGQSHNHIAAHDHSWTETHSHASKRAGGSSPLRRLVFTGSAKSRLQTHHMVTGNAATGGATNSSSGFSTAATANIPHYELLGIFNTSGVAKTSDGVIIPYVGSVASLASFPEWAYCDGSAGTPDLRDRFLRMSQNDGDIGNTGGSDTHTHPGTQTHTHTSATHTHTTTVTRDQEVTVNNSTPTTTEYAYLTTEFHTHTWAYQDVAPTLGSVGIATAAGNHIPLNRSVIFIKKIAVAGLPAVFFGCNF